MNLKSIALLLLGMLALSACVVEPYGGRGEYGHGYERGVWRG